MYVETIGKKKGEWNQEKIHTGFKLLSTTAQRDVQQPLSATELYNYV